MPSHPIDFDIQAHLYSTPEGLAIFDEQARFQRWLRFEAALALSQAELGIIPQAAADTIQAKADLEQLDLEAIREGYRRSRNSLVPVLAALRQACGQHGDYVHHGATTQDALDTGQALEMQAFLSLVERDLTRIEDLLLALTARHRDQAMVGRTHSQQALPITLGLKTAVWLGEMDRHHDRLHALLPRALTGQLGGAVGSMAALGPLAQEVGQRTMQRLGLHAAPLAWHTARDTPAEIGAFCGLLTASCAKIANEVFQLGKTEIMELREPAPAGKGAGSSTMPHKQNPVLCERTVVLASHVRALSQVVMEAMLHENERDPRALWSEWLALPQIAIYTLTALHYLAEILAGLEVFPERMQANLHQQRGAIGSEWLVFTLSPHLGKAVAQRTVERCLAQAAEGGRSLTDCLRRAPELAGLAETLDLSLLEAPESYLGLAPQLAETAMANFRRKRQARQG